MSERQSRTPEYLGEFESDCNDGRVVISHCFDEQNAAYRFRGSPVVLVPLGEAVFVFNDEYFVWYLDRDSDGGAADWLRGMDWTRSVRELVAKYRLQLTCPVYQTNHVSPRVRSVVEILEKETSSAGSRLSGGDSRRLLRKCLSACGVKVQMTVRMLDRRTHLMLGVCDGDDRDVTIIECRQEPTAPGCMEVSEVMRLYGLTGVIGNEPSQGETLIAWTAGLSSRVGSSAKVYEMKPRDRFVPLDWIRRKTPESEEEQPPLLKPARIDERGRLYLPSCLVEYLGMEGGKVTVVGSSNHLEIWSTERWDSYVESKLSLYGEFLFETAEQPQPEADE